MIMMYNSNVELKDTECFVIVIEILSALSMKVRLTNKT